MALRRQPVFYAIEPEVLSSGLLPDVQSVLKPLWEVGVGVRFIDGKVTRKRENTRLMETQGSVVRGIGQQTLVNQDRVLWFVSGDKLWRWDGFYLQQLATLGTLGLNSPYADFTFYGDWAFINVGVGAPLYWDGNAFALVPQMPVNITLLRKHLSFLMAFGTGSRKTGVSWSDASDVKQWTPLTTNAAGSVFFDEFDSPIRAAAPLGPHQAVYSANQMGLVTFIGDPFYFGQRMVLMGIGAVGKAAVASDGKMNYGVSRNGIWQTNGVDFRYLDSGKLHKHLQENVDWEQANKIIATRNDLLRTFEFYFPLKGQDGLVEGWCYDPITESFGAIPAVDYQDERTIFSAPIVASKDGWLELLDTEDANVDNMSLVTKPMLLQHRTQDGLIDSHTTAKVDEIELLLHKSLNMQMRIGSALTSKDEPRWSSWIELSLEKSTYNVPAGVPDGVYWTLEFRSQATAPLVFEDAEQVLDGDEPVVAASDNTSWDFDLQGFLLFGQVLGAKP